MKGVGSVASGGGCVCKGGSSATIKKGPPLVVDIVAPSAVHLHLLHAEQLLLFQPEANPACEWPFVMS